MSTATSATSAGDRGPAVTAGSPSDSRSDAHLDIRPEGAAAEPAIEATGFRSDSTADRVMRRLLRVDGLNSSAGTGAHRAFRVSVLVSAVRCLITYLAIPIVFPLLSLSGWVAAPIGIALCVVAVVNGVISVRRFWASDHPRRWMYTGFMGVVFVILAVAMVSELHRMGVM